MSEEGTPGASYRFVPVVREGFRPKTNQFALDRPKEAAANKLTGPLSFGVKLDVEGTRAGTEGGNPGTETASQQIRMYGPGDALGIDQEQIIRVEPEPNTKGSPQNYFPMVEFARADLPWLLSPESTKDDDEMRARTRPWISLVVVDKSNKKVSVTADGGGGLPVLKAPPNELPPPSETWAWAHAQVVETGTKESVADVIKNEPSRAVSRLLCPRNLTEGTRYVAAVVPTFEPGRRAGLGWSPYPDSDSGGDNGGNGGSQADGPSQQPMALAWPATGSSARQLPVYYMWEFTPGGPSFETLADKLEPRALSGYDVGARPVDASHPGPGRLVADETVDQVGALMAPSLADELDEYALTGALEDLVNRKGEPYESTNKPVVAPPLYGQWYPDVEKLHDPSESAGLAWLHQLNVDPIYRIAAGLGTEAVRENQEQYVAAAWDRAGQLRETNSLLREGQFARAGSNRIFDGLTDTVGDAGQRNKARLLQFTRPIHEQVPEVGTASVTRSLKEQLDVDGFPSSVLSPSYRRLTSPRGPLVRNAGFDVGGETGVAPTAFVEDFSDRGARSRVREDLAPRVVTLDDVAGNIQLMSLDVTDAVIPGLSDEGEGADGVPSELFGELQGAGIDPSETAGTRQPTGVDVVTEDLLRAQRFGKWARDLPGRDLQPEDVLTATPDEPETYAIRKVGAQLQSTIGHTWAAIEYLQALSAQESDESGAVPTNGETDLPSGGTDSTIDPGEVARRVEAVGTATFGPLNRTLDGLLSTRTGSVPHAISSDKDAFVQELVNDHHRAVTAIDNFRRGAGQPSTDEPIDPDDPRDVGDDLPVDPEDPWEGNAGREPIDPNRPPDFEFGDNRWIDESVAHMEQLLERLERLRGGLVVGEEIYEPPGGYFGGDDSADPLPDGESRSLMGLLDPEYTVPEKVLSRLDVGSGGTGPGSAADGGGPGAALRNREDPLDPVMWAPSFGWPMVDPLKRLSEEYLMPGVDDVPRNSVGAVASNPAFIESFMTGANHEFARELMWRRFPTDRRGTYFRTFWNKASSPTTAEDDRPDIDPIHEWTADQNLGGNINTPNVVLVVRGELLRRFPNTTIYMVKATRSDSGNRVPKLSAVRHVTEEAVKRAKEDDEDPLETRVEFPSFRGTLDPDITFLGFDLTPKEAVGTVPTRTASTEDPPDPEDNLGWFFVFEEATGETRFGLDQQDGGADTTAPMGVMTEAKGDDAWTDVVDEEVTRDKVDAGGEVAWNGLAWNHLVPEGENPDSLTHVRIWDSPPGDEDRTESKTWRVTEDKIQEYPQAARDKPGVESMAAVWGRNAAHMARLTWQLPVRVTIHADDLLSAEADTDNHQ